MREFNKTLNPLEFENVLRGTINMIEDAFAYCPNHNYAEEFIKSSSLSHSQWSKIINNEKPGYIFQDRALFFIKTPDNKIDQLPNYINRLEKALINVQRLLDNEKEQHGLTSKELDRYRQVSAWGHLKLSIKKLFKRS